ncbi:hypothetical protein RTP6_001437 [Batrachochytrium dendrobatidis]
MASSRFSRVEKVYSLLKRFQSQLEPEDLDRRLILYPQQLVQMEKPREFVLQHTHLELNSRPRKKICEQFTLSSHSKYFNLLIDVLELTPGPNKFFPQTTRTGLSKGPAFSLQATDASEADCDTLGKDTPGPGKYNPTYIPSKESKAPAYSIQPRRQTEKINENPGPAQYEINSTLGMHPVVTISAAAAYSIRSQRPIRLDQLSPGPAAYSPVTNSKLKHSAPAYSLGARLDKPDSIKIPRVHKSNNHGESTDQESDQFDGKNPTPGPGQYTPSLKFVRQNIPRFSFRCKHSDYELFIPDCLEGGFSL